LIILRERLIELYRRELNAKVKERLLLLVIRVIVDGELLPAHVVKEIHRSKPLGSYWLERYDKEGIKGLRDKPRSGRIPQISLSISTRIRKTLRESRHGWTTRQANDLIVNESGIHYHYTHVYRLLHRWGFKQKVPRMVHVNTGSNEEKEEFKKEQRWF
jgi:putative transposase